MNGLRTIFGFLFLFIFSTLTGQVIPMDSIYVYKIDSNDSLFLFFYQPNRIQPANIKIEEVDSLVFFTRGPKLINGDLIYIYNRNSYYNSLFFPFY